MPLRLVNYNPQSFTGVEFRKVLLVTKIDESQCFKELRTTYISKHRTEFGDTGQTAVISDHNNLKVVDKHYTAQMDAIKKSEKLSIFSDTEECVN